MKKNAKTIKVEGILLFLLFVLAAFFRFRGLTSLAFFTYDQARDALYIKRILDGRLRLIGTQSSIPGLYTGPFYYYFMAPFLALSSLNPIGLDFATAILSLLSVFLLFKILKEETNNLFLTLIITSLFAFSPAIVAQARFAWNPNPLPLFALLFLLSLKRILFDKKEAFLPLLGFAVGAAINLHYSSLAFIFILFLVPFFFWGPLSQIKNKKFLGLFFAVLAAFFLPLLLFDLRHGLINSRNIYQYLLRGAPGEIPAPPFFSGVGQKLTGLFGLVFNLPKIWLSVFTILVLLASLREFVKKQDLARLVFLTLVAGVLFSSFYRGSFFFFYLTFLYPLPFLLFGLLFQKVFKGSLLASGLLALIAAFVLSKNIAFLSKPLTSQRTIKDLSRVSQILASKIRDRENFNLVAAYKESDRFDHNAVDYRYFLEAKFGIPVPGWDVLDYQNAEVLYVISEVGSVEKKDFDFWETGLMGELEKKAEWDLGENYYLYQFLKK
jgi:4-amino-4-deoxy-L-arabinose transferase-like glycosyltransferase